LGVSCYATETGSESKASLMSFSFGDVRTIREYWPVGQAIARLPGTFKNF